MITFNYKNWSIVAVLLLFGVLQSVVTISHATGFDCASVTEIPNSECEALVDFYDSTNGSDWISNTGWKQTNTPCSWYGVSCDSGHISELHLDNNNLSGALSDMADLPFLQNVTLSDNQLSGGIPDFQLPLLQELQISGNPFGGTLPDFSNMANLREFRCGQCQLTGTIPDFSNMTHLRSLWLDNNQLSGTVPSFTNLTTLETLELMFNAFDNIPDISGLPGLIYLGLGYNQLTGNIPDFSHISNLEWLDLNNNQLTGSIPDFSNLPNLKNINLYSNNLTGTIPTFSASPRLESIGLGNNYLEGQFPDLSSLSSLNSLYLDNNRLRGVIPSSFCSMTLEYGSWGYNMLDIYNTDECVSFPDNDWRDTQTVPPTNIHPTAISMDEVVIQWDIIPYTGDGGYYELLMSNTAGGSYTSAGVTSSKLDNSLTVNNLTPGSTYYLVVRTFTPAHGDQKNDLTSDNSYEIVVMILDIAVNNDDVVLSWTPTSSNSFSPQRGEQEAPPATFDRYEILYSQNFYFSPDDPGVTSIISTEDSWTHVGAGIDTEHNYGYMMRGINDDLGKSEPFNRVGKFTFILTPG